MTPKNSNTQSRLFEKLPDAFYFFQFDPALNVFSVFINKSCMKKLEKLSKGNRLQPIYKEKYFPEHKSNTASFKTTHGFNDCGKIDGMFGNFLKISFKLNPVYIVTKKKCKECNGTGKNLRYTEYNWDCGSCHGLKKELENNQTPLRATVNTLSLLLALLDCYHAIYEEEQSPRDGAYKHQMYIIRTCVDREMNGHALGGGGSGFLKKQVAQYFAHGEAGGKSYEGIGGPYVTFETALKMMRDAYRFIYVKPKTKDSDMGFDHIDAVSKADGFFHLQTEGTNSCSLYSDHHGMNPYWYKGDKEERGYPLSCHNVDTSFQQMILIIGLAGLTEEIIL